MSLVHGAYLFESEVFLRKANSIFETLDSKEQGYAKLRQEALEIFAQNHQVRALLEEYGGWSKSAIETQFPIDKPHCSDDITFWLMINLFQHLEFNKGESTHQMGLGPTFLSLNRALEILGWQRDQRELLIWGHEFKHLPTLGPQQSQQRPENNERSAQIWQHLRPFSTGGRVGWLSANDVVRLFGDLQATEVTPAVTLGMGSNEVEGVSKVFELAAQMLLWAQDKKTGLCLIVSG